jgi:serine/threonine protein kinase
VLGSHSLAHHIFVLLEFCPQNLVAEMKQALGCGLPALHIAHIFASVPRAVRAMHCRDSPIIHRDLKPENVVAVGDVWKLCDFGSATRTVYDLCEREADIPVATADIEGNTTPISRAPEMVDASSWSSSSITLRVLLDRFRRRHLWLNDQVLL